MKARYIVLIIIIVLILAVVGIFLYERAHVSFHQLDEGITNPITSGTAESTSASVTDGARESASVSITDKQEEDIEELVEVNEDISPAEETKMKMIIADTEVEVLWEDNATVAEIKSAVADGPVTIEMSMYGGFEQVGSFGRSFTRDDRQTTTSAGDLVLYSGNQLVVFYGSNSWAYTRLGKIQGLSEKELTDLLANGDVTIIICKEK